MLSVLFFFFNDTATTEIYTLSLHDALPICDRADQGRLLLSRPPEVEVKVGRRRDRKSTRLNSSHVRISYAVFCLKKKKQKEDPRRMRHQNKVRCLEYVFRHTRHVHTSASMP